jgi:hypothetical protein
MRRLELAIGPTKKKRLLTGGVGPGICRSIAPTSARYHESRRRPAAAAGDGEPAGTGIVACHLCSFNLSSLDLYYLLALHPYVICPLPILGFLDFRRGDSLVCPMFGCCDFIRSGSALSS